MDVQPLFNRLLLVAALCGLAGCSASTANSTGTTKPSIKITNVSYDPRRDVITLDARIKNASKDPLSGPIKVRVLSVYSDRSDGVTILNSDNEKNAAGAVWDFSGLINGNALKPNEASEPKKLIFHLSNPQQPAVGGVLRSSLSRLHGNLLSLDGSLISLDARTLGKTSSSR